MLWRHVRSPLMCLVPCNNPTVDLYLIRPPPGAKHKPINPNHITVYGDSAGGGLTFALLQLLRDNNLPAPAGKREFWSKEYRLKVLPRRCNHFTLV